MRTKTFAIAISLLSTVCAFGHIDEENNGNDQGKMHEKNSSSPSYVESPSTYTRGQKRSVTPDAGPRVQNGYDLTTTVDFIWWKARQDGLAYATSGVL